MRVLVIEDETRLAATLQDLLELNGWTADVRHDGESGLDDALTGIYDDLAGCDAAQAGRLHGAPPPPGGGKRHAGADAHRPVRGGRQGGGPGPGGGLLPDQALRPQGAAGLRPAPARRQPELRDPDSLEFGGVRLDKGGFTLSCGEKSVRLSRKEFDICELLMLNRGLVLTKESLLLKIWG